MSGVSDEAEGLARDIYKYNLKASASVKSLFGDFEAEEAEAAMLVAFRELKGKVDDEQRLRRIVLITEQLAQNVGSEALMIEVQQTIEESDELQQKQGVQDVE